MTSNEHTLHVLMLARVNQTFSAIYEILKSRGIITADDLAAFHFAAWDDNRQLLGAVAQARSDYLNIAKLAGVEVPPDL
jgi:hypothetical protein